MPQFQARASVRACEVCAGPRAHRAVGHVFYQREVRDVPQCSEAGDQRPQHWRAARRRTCAFEVVRGHSGDLTVVSGHPCVCFCTADEQGPWPAGPPVGVRTLAQGPACSCTFIKSSNDDICCYSFRYKHLFPGSRSFGSHFLHIFLLKSEQFSVPSKIEGRRRLPSQVPRPLHSPPPSPAPRAPVHIFVL